MQPVSLFDLATQQARWLAVRQSAVAGNIANVNTPNYAAAEIEPFESLLDKPRVTLAATDSRHIVGGSSDAANAIRRDDNFRTGLPSENTVVLEEQLMKAGQVRRDFELNTAIVKSFHRMLLMSVRT